jgi:hypothetical protein
MAFALAVERGPNGRFPERLMSMDDVPPAPPPGTAPAPLWAIALVAVSPFPVAAAFYAYGQPDQATVAIHVLLSWSMVVMAFLGGIRWGLETARPVPRWNRLVGSIVSPAAAWGFYLSRGRLGPAVVIGGFIAAFLVQWVFDHRAPNMPARYPRLSTMLTAAACISLGVAMEQAMHS